MRDLIGTRKEVLESTIPYIPSITEGTCDITSTNININLQKILGYTLFSRGETENYTWSSFKSKYNPKAALFLFREKIDPIGHAVAIFDRGDYYEYYDTHGVPMLKELEALFKKKPNPMKVNTTRFQTGPTCLRHALIRLAFPQLSNVFFNALVIKTARETGFTPEQAIVSLSNNILKGVVHAPGRQSGMGKLKKCRKCGGFKI